MGGDNINLQFGHRGVPLIGALHRSAFYENAKGIVLVR
jgi:hypothetical protein